MRRPIIEKVVGQFQRFASLSSFGGIVLLACTVVALAWANSPWSDSYHSFWHTDITLSVGPFTLSHSLGHWINDGLMVVFFFVVGLEIKRELLIGELASPQKAMFPIMAALGGMVVPAGFYAIFNAGTDSAHGWGIPMATDIAFAIGILALLGNRVPIGVKIFLTAFAIVDDLGAVLVIALFYTAEISWMALGVGAFVLTILFAMNYFHIRHPIPYAAFGILLWLAFLKSGVHATVSGVLLAMTIPALPALDPQTLVKRGRELLSQLEGTNTGKKNSLTGRQQAIVQEIEDNCDAVESPMQSLEHGLHPWVTFFIMPVFALANAGVTVAGGSVSIFHPVGLGIILGLVFGKLIGVSLFAWLSVKLKMASLPEKTTWRHIYGSAMLGGIGFTMSLFISNLAFSAFRCNRTDRAWNPLLKVFRWLSIL